MQKLKRRVVGMLGPGDDEVNLEAGSSNFWTVAQQGSLQISIKNLLRSQLSSIPRVYKELHDPAYFCLQLPGKIVFDSKQLSFEKTVRREARRPAIFTLDPKQNPGGSWYFHTNGH
jgi:hypothetical protein